MQPKSLDLLESEDIVKALQRNPNRNQNELPESVFDKFPNAVRDVIKDAAI